MVTSALAIKENITIQSQNEIKKKKENRYPSCSQP